MMKYGDYNVFYNKRFKPPEEMFASEQRENMNAIYKYFKTYNWRDDPIKAIIACLCVLSSCNPWLLPQGVEFEYPETLAANTGGMGLQQLAPGYLLYEFMLQHDLDIRDGNSSLFKIRWDYANGEGWTGTGYFPDWQSFWNATGNVRTLSVVVWTSYFHIAQIPEELYNVADWMDKYFNGSSVLIPLEISTMSSKYFRFGGVT